MIEQEERKQRNNRKTEKQGHWTLPGPSLDHSSAAGPWDIHLFTWWSALVFTGWCGVQDISTTNNKIAKYKEWVVFVCYDISFFFQKLTVMLSSLSPWVLFMNVLQTWCSGVGQPCFRHGHRYKRDLCNTIDRTPPTANCSVMIHGGFRFVQPPWTGKVGGKLLHSGPCHQEVNLLTLLNGIFGFTVYFFL